MSAGATIDYRLAKRTNDLRYLAPLFRDAVEAALAEFNTAQRESEKSRAIVYETFRSDALQLIYYAKGRQTPPPGQTVTNAKSNLYSWHGYGLAVDIIHEKKEWGAAPEWFADVAAVFKKFGCKWGGDWKM